MCRLARSRTLGWIAAELGLQLDQIGEDVGLAPQLVGGIIGTLMDCHSNWTAAEHLMRSRGVDRPPTTVTADFHVFLRRPTPSDRPLHLRARVVESSEDRATVEAELSSGGTVTATCRATFVAVGPGHPAYNRW